MTASAVTLLFVICLTTLQAVLSQSDERYEVILNDTPKYVLAWEFTQNKESILFDAVAETTGYVGLGLSKTGNMTGADFLIGGITDDGSYYYDDYHGIGNQAPIVDDVENWFVAVAMENATHTTLLHERKLDTNDTLHDTPIQDEEIYLLWSMGSTDDLGYHGQLRGALIINLLNPFSSTNPTAITNEPTSVVTDSPTPSTDETTENNSETGNTTPVVPTENTTPVIPTENTTPIIPTENTTPVIPTENTTPAVTTETTTNAASIIPPQIILLCITLKLILAHRISFCS